MPLDPIDIRVYTALITQTTTDNPTLIELFNTTGAIITASRVDVGQYRIDADEAVFTEDKTAVWITPSPGTATGYLSIQWGSPGNIYIQSGLSGVGTDGLLYKDTIEIRIYYY